MDSEAQVASQTQDVEVGRPWQGPLTVRRPILRPVRTDESDEAGNTLACIEPPLPRARPGEVADMQEISPHLFLGSWRA
eukprot:CAMPEP_0117588436 /NCGR_PEP_ID=MMETSP0784-20121206/69852_1 /TAXON_ID=39447 /ORGANISM="" /LENGTH=78 /DNA_ID=CAMNT_0005389799 /DNA_START=1 /DNA_END=234 /DNA_ORIENTATION=+